MKKLNNFEIISNLQRLLIDIKVSFENQQITGTQYRYLRSEIVYKIELLIEEL